MAHWSKAVRTLACWPGGTAEMEQHATFADWWGTTQKPQLMLDFLYVAGYDDARMLRLLAVRIAKGAVTAKNWSASQLLYDGYERVVATVERYANGQGTEEDLAKAQRAAERMDFTARVVAGLTIDNVWEAVWATLSAVTRVGTIRVEGDAVGEALGSLQADHASIVRDMISLSEIEPLVNQYIGERAP